MNITYLCVIYFISWLFLAVTHFVILCAGYCFAEGMRFVHQNAAQLSGIFFSKSADTKLVYKLVGTLFTSCSLLSACFFSSLFLFCLPDVCTCAIFGENQNKCKPSIYPKLTKMFSYIKQTKLENFVALASSIMI